MRGMSTEPATNSTLDVPHESLWWTTWKRLRQSLNAMLGLALVLLMAVVALTGPMVAPNDYRAQVTTAEARRAAPSWEAPFGRDDIGRCVLSRVLNGAWLTLGVGVATVGIGLALGVPLGLASGYFGGWVDSIIMRLSDILLAFPDYLLALAVMSALEPSLMNAMISVGLLFIPKFARLVRAAAMQEAGRDYVMAARALGAGHVRLIARHVLPNCLAPILVISTLSLGTAILYTSALSFLGLGAQPPAPEWGAMLAAGREAFLFAPHIVIFPGLAIMLAVLGVNLLGDGLRDALDVRLK